MLNTFWPDRRRSYYRDRDNVAAFITDHWQSMGLLKNEAAVLVKLIASTTPTWPWKYVLMGASHFTGNRFLVANESELRRAISGLRRKGFVNAGKVEQEGRGGQWHGIPVRYPVLEAAPDLIRFCRGERYEFTVQDITLTGHLKVSKVKGRPCPNVPSLTLEDFLYDGSVKSSLLYEGVDSDGEDCVDLHNRNVETYTFLTSPEPPVWRPDPAWGLPIDGLWFEM